MNVGYLDVRPIFATDDGEYKLEAVYEANHYYHRNWDGRTFNEYTGYYINDYRMTRRGAPDVVYNLPAMVEARDGTINVLTDKPRLRAHWKSFTGNELPVNFRMPNRKFKSTAYSD